MSRKAYVRPKKRVGEIFRFLQSLISLGHKLKEQSSEKLGNFVLVALMLRDSVECVRRIRNYSPHMKWEERRDDLQEYLVRLYLLDTLRCSEGVL